MWVAFALQKLLTFLQQNINVFENTSATTVNEFVINKLVKLTMLWTTGPSLLMTVLIYPKYSDMFNPYQNYSKIWISTIDYGKCPKISNTLFHTFWQNIRFLCIVF